MPAPAASGLGDAVWGATGLVNAFGGLGGFAGAYAVGWLTNGGAKGAAFLLMAASQLVASLLILAVRPRKRRLATSGRHAATERLAPSSLLEALALREARGELRAPSARRRRGELTVRRATAQRSTHEPPGNWTDVTGLLISVLALAVMMTLALALAIARRRPPTRGGGGEEEGGDDGGSQPRVPPQNPPGPGDVDPEWWWQFERDLAEYTRTVAHRT